MPMNALDKLTAELDQLYPEKSGKPKPALSKEELSFFFDGVVMPAFEKIKTQMNVYSIKVFPKKLTSEARVLVQQGGIEFQFHIEFYSLRGCFEIYSDVKYPFCTFRFCDAESFGRDKISLEDYQNITEDRIIEWFTERFLAKNKVMVNRNRKYQKLYKEIRPQVEELIKTRPGYGGREGFRRAFEQCQIEYFQTLPN